MDFVLAGSAEELIQLSLAPVFLLVGIGQIINVVTGRLARVIDRARLLDERFFRQTSPAPLHINDEIKSLQKRIRFANLSVNFLTGAAVMVCINVIFLLVNGLIISDLNGTIIGTFIICLLLITGGLIAFFLEVSLATATLKVTVDKSSGDH